MKLLREGLLVVLVAGLAFGCAHYQAKPISPAQTAATFESRSLGDVDLKKFLEENLKEELAEWPLKVWDFPRLTLVALHFHPSLDVARAQWGVAKAGVQTAGARRRKICSCQ